MSMEMRLQSLECPASMRPHANAVLQGEYALPRGYRIEPPIRVLDIGANVGAFALWARETWPGCELDCYEPHPENVALLRRNVAHLRPGVTIHDHAVVEDPDARSVFLFDGRNNCGESSIWLGDEQRESGRMVDAMPANDLPPADVVKVDTEGAELAILRGYLHLDRALVVMLEYHRYFDQWAIGALLAGSFECLRHERRRKDRGIMVWLRDDDAGIPA